MTDKFEFGPWVIVDPTDPPEHGPLQLWWNTDNKKQAEASLICQPSLTPTASSMAGDRSMITKAEHNAAQILLKRVAMDIATTCAEGNDPKALLPIFYYLKDLLRKDVEPKDEPTPDDEDDRESLLEKIRRAEHPRVWYGGPAPTTADYNPWPYTVTSAAKDEA